VSNKTNRIDIGLQLFKL